MDVHDQRCGVCRFGAPPQRRPDLATLRPGLPNLFFDCVQHEVRLHLDHSLAVVPECARRRRLARKSLGPSFGNHAFHPTPRFKGLGAEKGS